MVFESKLRKEKIGEGGGSITFFSYNFWIEIEERKKIGIYNNKRDEKNIQIFQIDILKKNPQREAQGHKNGYATNTFFSFLEICIYQPPNLLILFLYIYSRLDKQIGTLFKILLNRSGMIEKT